MTRLLPVVAVVIPWLIAALRLGQTDSLSLKIMNGNGQPNSTTVNANTSSSIISRDHVTVFFDHRVRYHLHEADNAYSKEDLTLMVNIVSTRFSKLIIDSAPKLTSLPPDEHAPSRVWIPSIIAQHNLLHPNSPPLEVIISFEFDPDLYGSDPTAPHETSFDVAKYMADTANQLHPGTCRTLMMTMYHTEKLEYADESHDYSYWQYIQDWHSSPDESPLEVIYIEHLHHLAWPYQLGLFMDIHDCGRYRGPLGTHLRQVLPFISLVALQIDPTTFHHLTTLSAEETMKMFVAKFEDCERKIKEVEPGIRVVPSTLWKSHHYTIKAQMEEWREMSNWAEQNGREVIMYEAFDTPGGRDFYYWGHGWWRLRDRTAYQLNETSFVEKIEDAGSEIYTKDLYDTVEGTSSLEDDEEGGGKHKDSSKNCTDSASSASQVAPPLPIPPPPTVYPPVHPAPPTIINTSTTNHGVYIVLILLTVLCTVLVLTNIYFHSKIIKNAYQSGAGAQRRFLSSTKSRCHSFHNPGLPSLDGGNMEGEEESPVSLMNQHYRPNNEGPAGSSVASIDGSVLEMTTSDTTPIVSVAYKKL